MLVKLLFVKNQNEQLLDLVNDTLNVYLKTVCQGVNLEGEKIQH